MDDPVRVGRCGRVEVLQLLGKEGDGTAVVLLCVRMKDSRCEMAQWALGRFTLREWREMAGVGLWFIVRAEGMGEMEGSKDRFVDCARTT